MSYSAMCPFRRRAITGRPQRGFTLIELLVVVLIIGLLTTIALPGYRQYAVRGARVAAQAELLQLASLQEKIFLNSNSYAYGQHGITTAYDGNSAAGLGRTSGRTHDGHYELSLVTLASPLSCVDEGAAATAAGAQAFVLMATPVAGGQQLGDGNLCVSESGRRLWGHVVW